MTCHNIHLETIATFFFQNEEVIKKVNSEDGKGNKDNFSLNRALPIIEEDVKYMGDWRNIEVPSDSQTPDFAAVGECWINSNWNLLYNCTYYDLTYVTKL